MTSTNRREENIGRDIQKSNRKGKGITSTDINHKRIEEVNQIIVPSPFCWCWCCFSSALSETQIAESRIS